MKKYLVAALLLLTGPVMAEAPIPVEDFVRHATYSTVKISPDGEYLAMTVDREGQDVLTVLRTKDLGVVNVNQLPNEKSVGSFYWVSANRLMFNSIRKVGRYAQPFGTGEWYGVNADGSQPRPLVFRGTRGATERGKQVGNESFSLLDTLKDDPDNVIMSVNYPRSSEGAGTEVVLFDVISARRKSLGRAPRENCSIALDHDKSVRYAVCYDDEDAEGNFDTHNELYERQADGSWTLLNSSKSSGKRLSVLGTSGDGRIYATESDGKGTEAFGIIDPATGGFKRLFHDPVSDPSGYVVATDNETILGVITMPGAPRVTMVEESHPDAELYASLAASFPGRFVDFSSATRDGNQVIVSVYSDSDPGELYLYDREAGKARFLMRNRSWLDPSRMASVKSFAMKSRDGLTLYGYLTIPKGSDGRDMPMIVNPHGGPMGPRDSWGFNSEAQMFASRGYAVLQVNFRGSGGFGKGFEDMAYGQWDTGIMNDILDATHWAINEGYADKDRICIYGASFGGYASMMAPAREPGLYSCAFGYVGAYDAEIQMTKSDTSDREGGRRYLYRALGATKEERSAMSPVNHADKITLPVYLAAGARDARCPPENTEAMSAALTAAGNPPEGMIIQSGEMHGFYKEENNLRLYTEMLAFFDRHIGGKSNVGDPAASE
ncbi:alpha/beta hydrolase family protein [Marilutibacter aestuarii]|uniref:alpha/beta hydrolase family protein n=1 Tax=Marilutibacter aestuarii TaxID=1706195 RepID=UPI001FEB3B67|nr:S9 family peptidase [Lysobacter aestuarii]